MIFGLGQSADQDRADGASGVVLQPDREACIVVRCEPTLNAQPHDLY